VETGGGRLVIRVAEATGDRASPVGMLGPAGLGTADGMLRLLEVQPAGGKPMSWEAFLRGRPEVVGSRVVAVG
jgi:methionyl-tRNA formyltransferase